MYERFMRIWDKVILLVVVVALIYGILSPELYVKIVMGMLFLTNGSFYILARLYGRKREE